MKASQLKYNTQEEIEKMNITFSEQEDKLRKILQVEHNTIDLINENLKLKESIQYLRSCYTSDMSAFKDKEEKLKRSADELEGRNSDLKK